jgi:hypothetical protein
MHTLINICSSYSQNWKLVFSSTKTWHSYLLSWKNYQYISVCVEIINELTQRTKTKVDLGNSYNVRNEKNAEAVLKSRDKDLFGISNFQGNINPITNVKLYLEIVLSSSLYSCEVWTNSTTNNTTSLRKMQHYSLKRIPDLRKLKLSHYSEFRLKLIGWFG